MNTPSYSSQYGHGSSPPHNESPESHVSTTSASSPLDLSPPPNRSLSTLFSNMDCNREKTQLFSWSDEKKTDYEEKKYLATLALRDKPKSSEPRTPTPYWAGFGFSKSMPHEVLKGRLDSCRTLTPVEEVPKEFIDSSCRTSVWDASSSHYQTGKVSQSTGRFLRKQQSLDLPSVSNSFSLTPSLSSSSSLFSNHSDSSANSSFNPLSGSKSSFDYNSPTKNVDLVEILIGIGLAKYVDYFQNVDIDFNTFLNLNDADLEEIGIPYFGRRKITMVIADLLRALRDYDQLYHFEAAPGAERKQRATHKI